MQAGTEYTRRRRGPHRGDALADGSGLRVWREVGEAPGEVLRAVCMVEKVAEQPRRSVGRTPGTSIDISDHFLQRGRATVSRWLGELISFAAMNA